MTKVILGRSDERGGCRNVPPNDSETPKEDLKLRGRADSKASKKELSPMALGVLNNLSAIYAENNLNNTNSSLQTVLQQLSSGSRINSGADDAAGLSLVNGLAANSAALTQSKTNATEGVGLLQVADGALSQVTSLLNRAITLATEASNGTLNSTQEGAANQEYQSILAEINNIGTTTTYNQQAVFSGQTTAIYTGDSSSTGSSVIDLNIRSLSEESVGDTGGTMSYSSGQNNVFLNLSSSTADAAVTDTLNTLGTTSIDVNYLVQGSNGTSTTATTQITVGGATNYSNTAAGLISAINSSGLGLTATFATQGQAGVVGGGTQTGIEIAGAVVSAGVDPSSSSTSGILDPSGIPAGQLLKQGQNVTVTVGTAPPLSIQIGPTIATLSQLADAINFPVNPSTQNPLVTATVITNGDGSQSLSLQSAAGKGALSVTANGGNAIMTPVFANGGTGTLANATVNLRTPNTTNATGVALKNQAFGTLTVGTDSVDAAGTESFMTGSFVVTNTSSSGVATTETFTMGGTGGGTGTLSGTNFLVNGNTLAALMAAINGQSGPAGAGVLGLGVNAGLTSTGMTLTGAGGTTVAATATGTTYTNTVTGATPAVTTGSGAAANVATLNVAQSGKSTDVLSGSITLTNGTVTETFQMGAAAYNAGTYGGAYGSLTTATGIDIVNGNTMADLVNAINSQQAAASNNVSMHLNASASDNTPAGLTFTSKDDTTQVAVGPANTLTNGDATLGFFTPALSQKFGEYSTALLALTNSSGTQITGGVDGNNLTGSITLSNGVITDTFVMGNGPVSGAPGLDGVALNHAGGNTYYVGPGGTTQLTAAITTLVGLEGATGINLDASAGPSGGIYLQGTVNTNTPLSVSSSTLAVAQAVNVQTGVAAQGNAADAGTPSTVTISSLTNRQINTSDVFTGSITLVNTPQGGPAVSETFNMGNTAHTGSASNFGTLSGTVFTVNGNTLADLQNAINAQTSVVSGSSMVLGLTALASTSGLSVSASTNNGNTVSISGAPANTLTDTTAGTTSTLSMGTFATLNDSVSGNLTFSVNGTPMPITLNAGETVQGMIDQINGTTYPGGVPTSTYLNGVTATWVPPTGSANFGSVLLTANLPGQSITGGKEYVSDTPIVASLNYVASSAYNTGVTSDSAYKVYDSSSNQSLTNLATFIANAKQGSGVAITSYSDGAGQALNGTGLLNQIDARGALAVLNSAITDVAAQDGYLGAEINTLNSISQVMSTQQENVVSAQNALQATDYASATSNMSKYEILSQTGIAALAQANSVQQEVTKLLQ